MNIYRHLCTGFLVVLIAVASSFGAAQASSGPTPQTPTVTLTAPAPSLPVRAGTRVSALQFPLSPLTLPAVQLLASWGDGAITAVAWSPDGDLLAAATDVGTYLYRPATLAQVRFYPSSTPVETVTFSPDGAALAVAAKGVSLYDTQTGNALWTKTLSLPASGVAFDTEKNALAVLVRDGEDLYLKRWVLADGKEQPGIQIHELYGQQLALSPDGRLIVDSAKGLISNLMRVWSADSGEKLFEKSYNMSVEFQALRFSPDGSQMAALTSLALPQTDLTLWDMQKFRVLGQIRLAQRPDSTAISLDNSLLAVTFSQEAQVWGLKNFQKKLSLPSENQFTSAGAVFSPDGSQLAAGALEVWDLTGKTRLAYHDHALRWNYALSPDSQRIALGAGPGIEIRSLADASLLKTLPVTGGKITNLEYSADGKRLAAATDAGKVYLWNTLSWEAAAELKGVSSPAFSLSFSPDNTILVVSFKNGAIQLWDAVTGKLARTWTSTDQKQAAVGFSPDGTLVEVNQKDLNFWQMPEKKLLRSFKGTPEFNPVLSFSSDGSTLILLTGATQLFETQSGMGKKCSTTEDEVPVSALMTPDGGFLAVSVAGGKIHLISASSCQVLYSLDNTLPAKLKLAPDRATLLSASGGVLRIWGVPNDR